MQPGITLQCCFLHGTRTALGLVAAMLLSSNLEANLVTLLNHECCEGKREMQGPLIHYFGLLVNLFIQLTFPTLVTRSTVGLSGEALQV